MKPSPGRATGHASVDPRSQIARGGHLPWPGLDATKSLRSDRVLGLFDGGVSSDGSLNLLQKNCHSFFGLIRSIFISVFLCLLSLSLPAQRCLLKDNSTRIHGKLHPMIAIITVGDCELLVLRRVTRAVSCAGRFEHDLRFTSKLQF